MKTFLLQSKVGWQVVNNYVEVIISDSNILLKLITTNLQDYCLEKTIQTILLIDSVEGSINEFDKIDVLIVDKGFTLDKTLLHHVKTFINFTKMDIPNAIKFDKPFKCNIFLDILKALRNSKHVFCRINENLVYDEQLGYVLSQDTKVRLTNTENAIFRYLLTHIGDKIHNNELLQHVLQYHPSTDSNTAETHLYRLKQKLSPGLINIHGNYCWLSKP